MALDTGRPARPVHRDSLGTGLPYRAGRHFLSNRYASQIEPK